MKDIVTSSLLFMINLNIQGVTNRVILGWEVSKHESPGESEHLTASRARIHFTEQT